MLASDGSQRCESSTFLHTYTLVLHTLPHSALVLILYSLADQLGDLLGNLFLALLHSLQGKQVTSRVVSPAQEKV